MRSLLLLSLAAVAVSLSGCTVVAEPPRAVGVGYTVQYYHGRPYYYRDRTRYWGYPPGYVVPRHHRSVVVYR
jgi:uncharacterized protein YceK